MAKQNTNQPNKAARSKRVNIYAAIAIIAIVGIILELIVSAQRQESAFSQPLIRALNFFTYFTAWMNMLVVGISFWLAKSKPHTSTRVNAIRLTTLAGLAVTIFIQYAYLAKPVAGLPFISDLFIHTITPVLFIVAWFIYGPPVQITKKVFVGSLIIPTVWIGLALLRGILTSWYPYAFLDISELGGPTVIKNVAILYGMLFAGMFLAWIGEKIAIWPRG